MDESKSAEEEELKSDVSESAAGKESQNHVSKSTEEKKLQNDFSESAKGKESQNHVSKSTEEKKPHNDLSESAEGKESQNHISESTEKKGSQNHVSKPIEGKESQNHVSKNQPISGYIGDNLFIRLYTGFQDCRKLVENINSDGIIFSDFLPNKHYRKMEFSPETKRIVTMPNARGTSVISEAVSFEFMGKCFRAHLVKVIFICFYMYNVCID